MGRFDGRAGFSRHGRNIRKNDGGAEGAFGDASGEVRGDAGFRRHDEGEWLDEEGSLDEGGWLDEGGPLNEGGWLHERDWLDEEGPRDQEGWLNAEGWHGGDGLRDTAQRNGRRAGRIFLYVEAVVIGIFLIWSAIAMLATLAREISRLLQS